MDADEGEEDEDVDEDEAAAMWMEGSGVSDGLVLTPPWFCVVDDAGGCGD